MSIFQVNILTKDLHVPIEYVSWGSTFRIASEISLFFLSEQLITAMGLSWMLVLAMLLVICRLVGIWMLPDAGNLPNKATTGQIVRQIAIPCGMHYIFELTAGVISALNILGHSNLTKVLAPKDLEDVAQVAFSAVSSGLAEASCGVVNAILAYCLSANKQRIMLINGIIITSIFAIIGVPFLRSTLYFPNSRSIK